MPPAAPAPPPADARPAPPRARRWPRRALGLLAGLAVLPPLAVAGALLFAATPPGLALLARLAEEAVPGLAVEGLAGPLPARLGAARLALTEPVPPPGAAGPWLTVEGLDLALDLPALWRERTLRVALLAADRVVLHRPPPPAADAPPDPPAAGPLLPSPPALPLALRLERLAIGRLELAEAVAGRAAALSVAGEAALADGALRAGLRLDRLDAPGTLDLALGLAPAGAGTPDQGRLSARLAVREPPGGLLARLAGVPERAARVDLTLEGPAAGAALRLDADLGPDLAARVAGTVRADGGGGGAALEGWIRAAPLLPEALREPFGALGLALDAGFGADRRLVLRPSAVATPAGTVLAGGAADLAAGTADLGIGLALGPSARLGALLPDLVAWEGLRAEATVSGSLAGPRIVLDAGLAGFASTAPQLGGLLGSAPDLALDLTLPSGGGDATLARLSVAGAGLEATLSGTAGTMLDLGLEAALPDLAAVQPGLAGAVRLEATATGPLADPTVTLRARSDRLEGGGRAAGAIALDARVETPASAPRVRADLEAAYAGLPVRLSVRGEPDGRRLRLEGGTARLGPATLEASGLIDPEGPAFDGALRLDVPDLAPLGRLAGQDLGGRLRLDVALEPGPDGTQRGTIRLAAPALRRGAVAGALDAAASGTADAFDVTLDARATGLPAPAGAAGPSTAALRARATRDGDGTRRLDLAALQLRHAGETVRLAAPARAALDPDGGVRLDPLTLATGRGGALRASGRWGPQRADLTVALNALPLALAGLALPDPPLEGTLSGEVAAEGPVADPALRADLRVAGLRAGTPWGRGLPAVTARLQGRHGGGGATEGRLEANAGAATRLDGTVRLPRGPGGDAPLEGALNGTADLAPLLAPFLAAGADRVAGRLALALRADGTPAAPRLGGTATLTGGEYRNLALGVRLTGIGGLLRADGERLVLERLVATAGAGTLSARGVAQPLAAGVPVDLTLTARGAQPLSSDRYRVTLDADLRVTGPAAGGARAGGAVRVTRAEIRVPESLPASIRTLPDVREVGRRPPGSRRPPAPAPADGGPAAPPYGLDLRVSARDVFVRGRGLDAELGGDLAVAGTTARPEVTGELALRRGQLQVLTRRLAFERGEVRFEDGTLNPSLDFLATARSQGTTLRATVTGSPSAPEIAFSSSPELPQDEVLARLLFDRPTGTLSVFEVAQLAQALAGATGLAGDPGGGFFERLRRRLGLDRLGVGGGDAIGGGTAATGPALGASRSLGRGVTVGVQQGTEAGSSRVGVEVELAPRLKLEGRVGAGGNARDRLGLSYEYEY